MSLSLDRDESIAAVAESVGRYCGSRGTGFAEAWRGAELGPSPARAVRRQFPRRHGGGDGDARPQRLLRPGGRHPHLRRLRSRRPARAGRGGRGRRLSRPAAAGALARRQGDPRHRGRRRRRAAGGGGRRARRDALRRSVGACARLGRPGARPLVLWADCYDRAPWLVGAGSIWSRRRPRTLPNASSSARRWRVPRRRAARAPFSPDAAMPPRRRPRIRWRRPAGDGRPLAARAAEQAAITPTSTAPSALEGARSCAVRQLAAQFPQEPVDALAARH